MLFKFLVMIPINFLKINKPKGFQKLKDLIRGTIITDIEEMQDAYKILKSHEHIKIIDVKEKLDAL